MTEHRWSKFWWQDWQADQALRSCSLAARGLWMDMLCIAHTGTPRGHVTINGVAVTPKRLAILTGASEREIIKLLAELEEAGVFSRTEAGVIFSRRMVRDTEHADAGREAVERRWSKTRTPTADPITPPNRSEMSSAPHFDGNPAKLNETKMDSQFRNAATFGTETATEIRQPFDIGRMHVGKPITPPNRGATGEPYTLEAEAEAEADKKGGERAPRSASPPRPERGSRLPADWQPSEPGYEGASAQTLARFRDYWLAQPGQRGVKTDWQATWRNWCRKDAEDRAAKPRAKTSQLTTYDQNAELVRLARETPHPELRMIG